MMQILLQQDGTFDLARQSAQTSLHNVVTISLFANARDDSTEAKHGWWADALMTRPVGSKLWKLARAKRTEQTRQLALDYVATALQWLIDDGHANTITVDAAWMGTALIMQIVLDCVTYNYTINYG